MNEMLVFGTPSTINAIAMSYHINQQNIIPDSAYCIKDPYNPYKLPAYTIRLLYKDGVTPSFKKGTGVQVSQSPNIWDLTYVNNDWSNLLSNHEDLLEVLGANAEYVQALHDTFWRCLSLTKVALFDTSNVTDMRQTFDYCPSLETVPLFDTSKVTNMYYMFGECRSLVSIPLFDTSNVTNMRQMFIWCTSLKNVPLFNMTNVTTTYYMFDFCSSLETVPLFNTSNVTDMQGMFEGCESLKQIPLFNTSKVTNMSQMFWDCYNVESGALALYQQASTQATPPQQHVGTFYQCGINSDSGSAELAQIPLDWKNNPWE